MTRTKIKELFIDSSLGVGGGCVGTFGISSVRSGWVVVVTGMEIAVGYAFAWLVRKARRVAGRVDTEFDRGLDAGMDRLQALIDAKLGQDPALERAREEAGAGREALSERTRQRLELALEDAAERDNGFAEALERAVKECQTAAGAMGAMSAAGNGQAVAGHVTIRADGGSAAALRMGDVSIGSAANPSKPGPEQG
jgi:hypothetical protein